MKNFPCKMRTTSIKIGVKFFSILGILFVFNFVTPYITWAKPVQVYDSNASDLHRAMYKVHKFLNSPYDFNELHYLGKLEKDSSYKLCTATIGAKGYGGTLITFYSNLSGYVSKISVLPLGDTHDSYNATALALTEILSGLGLNTEQLSDVSSRFNSLKHSNLNLWVNDINRSIIIEYKIFDDQLYYLITADDFNLSKKDTFNTNARTPKKGEGISKRGTF